MNATNDRLAELRLAVAEKLAYVCAECSGSGRDPHMASNAGRRVDCAACRGEGKVWPLREECFGCHNQKPYTYSQGGRDYKIFKSSCPHCQGRGWMPAEGGLHDLISAAAKCGIRLHFGIGRSGDWVLANSYSHDTSLVRLLYDPTDALGILCAAYEAVDEVAG